MFDSPHVQADTNRELRVGKAVLEANPHPLFLRGDPSGQEYGVYNLAGQDCDWLLRVGGQEVRGKQVGFGCATVVRKNGRWGIAP